MAHAAVGVQLAEQIQVDIRDEDHLRIGRRLGAFAVGREGKVARREDSRLGILDIHVVHAGQVADAAGDRHEALVLDGPCLCADPHARITVLRIGEEGHEEDLHALIGHDARQFGELHVVADQHADARTVRVKGLHHAAAAQTPAFDLVGRNVHLLVPEYYPFVSREEKMGVNIKYSAI